MSLQVDFMNIPHLHSNRATRLERLPIWPYGLCQREPKVPGLYKKHTATQQIIPEMRLETSERLIDSQTDKGLAYPPEWFLLDFVFVLQVSKYSDFLVCLSNNNFNPNVT